MGHTRKGDAFLATLALSNRYCCSGGKASKHLCSSHHPGHLQAWLALGEGATLPRGRSCLRAAEWRRQAKAGDGEGEGPGRLA